MKRKPLVLSLALLALFGPLTPRPAEAAVSFSYFYDNLSPYGDWVDADDYGYCWRPTGVDENWQPYTDGYWVFTDAGWTWVSYEDYGSITYHYGRWVRLEGYGWVWKPDYEWGPAWVSWRKSDDYIGWAPLPPEARFDASVGIGFWVDRDYDIGPTNYSFCEVRNFGAPVLRNVIIERNRNITIINNSVNITNITINKTKVVYNGGPDYRVISKRSARPIATLKLERRTDIGPGNHGKLSRTQRVGNQLRVDAPMIEKSSAPIAPPKLGKPIRQAKVDKGWGSVSDPAVRKQLHEKIEAQAGNKGERHAVKPVDEEALREVLPAKADPKGSPGGFGKSAERTETKPEIKSETKPFVPEPSQPSPQESQDKDKAFRNKGDRGDRGSRGGQKLQPFNPPPSFDQAQPKQEPQSRDKHSRESQKPQPFSDIPQPQQQPERTHQKKSRDTRDDSQRESRQPSFDQPQQRERQRPQPERVKPERIQQPEPQRQRQVEQPRQSDRQSHQNDSRQDKKNKDGKNKDGDNQ